MDELEKILAEDNSIAPVAVFSSISGLQSSSPNNLQNNSLELQIDPNLQSGPPNLPSDLPVFQTNPVACDAHSPELSRVSTPTSTQFSSADTSVSETSASRKEISRKRIMEDMVELVGKNRMDCTLVETSAKRERTESEKKTKIDEQSFNETKWQEEKQFKERELEIIMRKQQIEEKKQQMEILEKSLHLRVMLRKENYTEEEIAGFLGNFDAI